MLQLEDIHEISVKPPGELPTKKRKLDSSELAPRSFDGYFRIVETVVKVFGKSRLVTDLDHRDFAKLRDHLTRQKPKGSDTRSPWTLRDAIIKARSLFKYAFDNGLIDRPVRYGSEFSTPRKADLRRHKAMKGAIMFGATEIRSMLSIASVPMRAMILLAINAAFKNTDCADLELRFLDLDTDLLTFPRPKTGTVRKAILWPETVDALRDAIETRPEPKDTTYAHRVFLTRFGQPWVRGGTGDKGAVGKGGTDAICQQFNRMLDELGMKQHGIGFAALRNTFRTVADEVRDDPALNLIMGHIDDSMGAHYTQRIADDRLRRVTDHVHEWLFAG